MKEKEGRNWRGEGREGRQGKCEWVFLRKESRFLLIRKNVKREGKEKKEREEEGEKGERGERGEREGRKREKEGGKREETPTTTRKWTPSGSSNRT